MKHLNTTIIFLVLLCLFLPSISTGENTVKNDNSDIRVEYSPNVELLSIICRLAGYDEYNGGGIASYNQAVDQHFAPFKNHKVIRMTKELRKTRGMGYNAPMHLAVFMTDTTNPKARAPFNVLDQRWTEANAPAFMEAAADFAEKSDFNGFLQKHDALYQAAADSLKTVVRESVHRAWLNSFFGKSSRAKCIAFPALLNGGNNYAAMIPPAGGAQEFYAVMSTCRPDKKGMPVFIPTVTRDILIHEFCHSFANPLVDAFQSQLTESGQHMYPFVKNIIPPQYSTWESMMYESLVRASTCRYLLKNNGADAAKTAMKYDVLKGFLWVPELYELLGEYEAQRTKYPDMDSFMPRIADFFTDYSGRIEGIMQQRKKKEEKLIKNSPKILSMTPANGDREVDPNLTTFTVVFDRPMNPTSYAFTRETNGQYPETTGYPFYDAKNKRLNLPVKLKPGTIYAFGLNNKEYNDTRSADGTPLIPVVVRFKTRDK
ncbi:MAG: DUF4932 domain-containing protein [bacterium]|nr:DUF4932 domain-containing protein [bacterium]